MKPLQRSNCCTIDQNIEYTGEINYKPWYERLLESCSPCGNDTDRAIVVIDL